MILNADLCHCRQVAEGFQAHIPAICSGVTYVCLQKVTVFGSVWDESGVIPEGEKVAVEGCSEPAIVHAGGMTFIGNDGKPVSDLLPS